MHPFLLHKRTIGKVDHVSMSGVCLISSEKDGHTAVLDLASIADT